ncbi:MAG: class I SAM-dependent methyltransferase [Phycisphaerales bacterium]|jgi:SAM-dependent methyltransferase|nr:class I SAM-dependent methyltransferase [Phycisphaerales bacterium]
MGSGDAGGAVGTIARATPQRSVENWRVLHEGNAYFDNHARYQDRLHDRGVAQVLGLLRPSGDETLLEIGCGYGRLLHHLRPHVARVVGIELAHEPLAEAARLLASAGGAELHVGDGVTLQPLGDASIDCACCFTVFQHMTREGVRGYLLELARVLRPGGVAALQFLDDGTREREIVDEAREQSLGYSASQVCSAVEAAGLRVERLEREDLEGSHPGRGLGWWWVRAARPSVSLV